MRGIRVKDSEDLSPLQLEKVYNLLNSEKPITKKEACDILKISYNTSRLNKILEKYKEEKDYREKRKKEVKNKPLTESDIQYIISSYLEGESISAIADTLFRSSPLVKRTLEKYNIPIRNAKATYHSPVFLDDNSISEDYNKGDLVYSARYVEPAIIQKEYIDTDAHGKIYRIWLYKSMQYAYQPFYELGDLRYIQKKFNVKIEDVSQEVITQEIAKAIINARKSKKA